MKEKIIETLIYFENYVLCSDMVRSQLADDLTKLFNQEVEKRIKERNDEMEAIFLEKWIRTFNLYSDMSAFCIGYTRMREERDMILSRLSQKTEGGEE